MNDVAVEKTENLAADKLDQDSIQKQQVDGTKPMEKSTENVVSEYSSTEVKVAPCSTTQDAASALQLEKGKSIETLFQPANPVSIDVLAADMASLIRRHCVLLDHEIDAIVLWLISSHMINEFRIFPKLLLESPQKRCGKSTVMEVIQSLAKGGIHLSNISSAGIYRVTQQGQPTLLIDEADTFVKNGSPDLVGIINSSHSKKGSSIIRCVGDNHQPQVFNTWTPMVFASIGSLSDTIMDRSIVINLRRKKPQEQVVRVPVDLEDQNTTVRNALSSWCSSNEAAIKNSNVIVPNLGNDRAQDNWLPLYTIAEAIDNGWIERCEAAYRALTTQAEPELSTLLLASISLYFSSTGNTRISSSDLVAELCKDETGPWQECNNGRRVTQNQVARILRNYGISTHPMRFGESVIRGYERTDFTDAFERYIA